MAVPLCNALRGSRSMRCAARGIRAARPEEWMALRRLLQLAEASDLLERLHRCPEAELRTAALPHVFPHWEGR